MLKKANNRLLARAAKKRARVFAAIYRAATAWERKRRRSRRRTTVEPPVQPRSAAITCAFPQKPSPNGVFQQPVSKASKNARARQTGRSK
jgi:hypothetical protein